MTQTNASMLFPPQNHHGLSPHPAPSHPAPHAAQLQAGVDDEADATHGEGGLGQPVGNDDAALVAALLQPLIEPLGSTAHAGVQRQHQQRAQPWVQRGCLAPQGTAGLGDLL